MKRHDLAIRAPRAVLASTEAAATVCVSDGVIASIEPFDGEVDATEILELTPDVVLLPGLVDSHVHICEPGNTEWEGFETATKAAAAGGITTLVDMPLDSLPTTVNVAALEAKREAAGPQAHVDLGFWGGVIPTNLEDLAPLHRAGVLGFKCFLADSGSDDFPPVSVSQMEAALQVLAGFDATLLVHAESAEAGARIPAYFGRDYRAFLASKPRNLENLAVSQLIEAARVTGGRVHILHLSSSDALPMIATAKRDGVKLTAESCPHYLTLSAEEIGDGQTAFKCLPPVREAENRERLWAGLLDGTLDQIVSDHSPCTVEMKGIDAGDFGTAWGGVSSLQLGLPVIWTVARLRGVPLTDVVRWMAEGPAKLAGLATKGAIRTGFAADLCVFAPDETFVVDARKLHHRHPVTPYDGRELHGVVRQTFLRGRPVDFTTARGRLISRGDA